MIIVNADDYGISSETNKAIFDSINLGLISSTTLMCNMPGFDEAIELINENGLHNRIGIHFNLSEGTPLSKKILKVKKFCKDDGRLYKSNKGLSLTADEAEAVYEELDTQLQKSIQCGVKPTHFDSHHHMHHYLGIGKVVCKLAIENNIPAVRLRYNWGKLKYIKKVYSVYYNYYIKMKGLAKTKYFCELTSATPELLSKRVPIELMVHPVYNDKMELLNYYHGNKLSEDVERYLQSNEIISYGQLT